MLDAASARLQQARPAYPITLKVGNIEDLPFEDGSFDLVTSTGVIEYLKEDSKVLNEMMRVLRPGGHLILPVTNRWSPINAFDAGIEFLKRQEWFRRPFNLMWTRLGHGPILPRHFVVRKHRPSELRQSLAAAGFVLEDESYFFFPPLAPAVRPALATAFDCFGELDGGALCALPSRSSGRRLPHRFSETIGLAEPEGGLPRSRKGSSASAWA